MKALIRCVLFPAWLYLSATAVQAAQITGLAAQTDGAGQTEVTLSYSDTVTAPKIFTISGDKPRIVIDSPGSRPVSGFDPAPIAGVKRVRHAVKGEGSRIVLDLAAGSKLLDYSHSGSAAFVRLKTRAPVPAPGTVAAQTSDASGPIVSASGIPIPRVKPRGQYAAAAPAVKRLIVIDAGHGGYDPGAIGAAGTKEKSVTLAAAQELEKQLLKTGRYTVYLTREKDVYVDHYERVRRARVREADLFISLHADALESRKTRGASVYTLASYAQKRSTKLVDKQAFIVDVDLRDTQDSVGDILVSLAQKKTFSNSHKFAEMLIPNLEKVAPILRNTHRQKGLAVLLAPDVPAVLLEMGYISNPTDEKALKSPTQRARKMKAVVTTIDAYFAGQ